MKYLFFLCCFVSVTVFAQQKTYQINLEQVPLQTVSLSIAMKGVQPGGDSLSVNNRYFEKNGQPWFPLMGEMHYNRVPPQDWESGILKMKAAGLSIIATYVFWNEHETAPDVWDWKGNRNLRKFVELCAKHNMYVWLRIGPWSHGEQLHGGFPEWIQKLQGKRSNDPVYLAEATKLFNQVGEQTQGLFFKDGGPVIGVQLENEYASGQPEHISKLKEMALAANIQPVYWSVTANTAFDDTKMEVIPLQGSYPYRGWEKGGGKATKDFLYGNDQWILTDALGKLYYDINKFPKGLCEQGCGSQVTYANRFIVEPHIVEAHLQNQVGRGMNMVGYYMFHGGTQTPGLKEPGLPESYDFQSPVGEFGYIRTSYRYLKILHQFINDFGTELAQMQVVEAENPVRNELDTASLRYITRIKDNSGFIFLCNSQVRVTMPDKQVQLKIKLPAETISLPAFIVKGQTSPVLPFNLNLNGVLLKYVTAQPFARIKNDDQLTVFFQALPGVNPQLMIDAATIREESLKAISWKKKNGLITISAGKQKSVQLIGKDGQKLVLIFLSRKEAEDAWKVNLGGRDALIVTNADLITSGKKIELRQLDNPVFTLSIYPSGLNVFLNKQPIRTALFDKYSFSEKRVPVPVSVQQSAKTNEAFIRIPSSLPQQLSDVFIKVDYLGGSCKALYGDSILADHLFNGPSWLLGLNKFLGKESLQLQIQDWDDKITGVDRQLADKIKRKGPSFEAIKIMPQYRVILDTK